MLKRRFSGEHNFYSSSFVHVRSYASLLNGCHETRLIDQIKSGHLSPLKTKQNPTTVIRLQLARYLTSSRTPQKHSNWSQFTFTCASFCLDRGGCGSIEWCLLFYWTATPAKLALVRLLHGSWQQLQSRWRFDSVLSPPHTASAALLMSFYSTLYAFITALISGSGFALVTPTSRRLQRADHRLQDSSPEGRRPEEHFSHSRCQSALVPPLWSV